MNLYRSCYWFLLSLGWFAEFCFLWEYYLFKIYSSSDRLSSAWRSWSKASRPTYTPGLVGLAQTNSLASWSLLHFRVKLFTLDQLFFSPDIEFHPLSCLEEQREPKSNLSSERLKMQVEQANELRSQLAPSLQHSMDLSREKGASIWLSALPLESHGFSLHKQAFWDALYLRYGWVFHFMNMILLCFFYITTIFYKVVFPFNAN